MQPPSNHEGSTTLSSVPHSRCRSTKSVNRFISSDGGGLARRRRYGHVVGHLYDKAKKVKGLWCGGEVEDSHDQSKKKRTRLYNQVQPSIADPSLPYFYGVIFSLIYWWLG